MKRVKLLGEQMVEAFSNDLTHISEQLVKSIEVVGEVAMMFQKICSSV